MIESLPLHRQSLRQWTEKNGYSDHYGAIDVACDYAGVPRNLRQFNAIWHHGCAGPWENTSPERLTMNVQGAELMLNLVARDDQKQYLKSQRFPFVQAIGLPYIYCPKPSVARHSKSLLVVPTHTLVGQQVGDRAAFQKYVDEISEFRDHFDSVLVCLHPNCYVNGFWIDEFSAAGFKIIKGADIMDANALPRMRMLFATFSTVTTNGWGSHVAYALVEGCRLSIFGTCPSISTEQMLKDHTWAVNPESLMKLLSPEVGLAKTAYLRNLYRNPIEAVSDVEMGRFLVGTEHQIKPSQMRELLFDALQIENTATDINTHYQMAGKVQPKSGAKLLLQLLKKLLSRSSI